MDYIDGVHLSTRGIGRALLPHEVIRVSRGLLDGLAEAHHAGLIHRDLKPSNLLVLRERPGPDRRDGLVLEEPRILDFGIADRPALSERSLVAGETPSRVLGTAAYLAPELLEGERGTTQSDIYALGLVLFELLDVGDLHPGESLAERLDARRVADPVLGERVSPPLYDLLVRMLARDPAARFVDAREALVAVADLDTAPVSIAPPPPTREVDSSPMTTRDFEPPMTTRAGRGVHGLGVNATIAPGAGPSPSRPGRSTSRACAPRQTSPSARAASVASKKTRCSRCATACTRSISR
jgi:serine/threonine-protein kinase